MIIISGENWDELMDILNATGEPDPDIVALARSKAPWDQEPWEHDREFIPAKFQRIPSGAPRCWRLANRWAVPHTGRRSGGHYFRRPRNIGVKRATVADDGTLRGAKVPPSDWQDITIEAARSRNWKRHRKTQWRERYMV